MKFQGKLTTQTQEKCEKPHFGSNTGSLDPYSNGQNLASSVTRYHGQLSSCTISEKNDDSILRKCSDERTNR